jgi:transcriptional regulator with XRE-family HTH domain
MKQAAEALYEDIGCRIADRRRALSMTQLQLARAIGLQRASVANIESGRQAILVDTLYLIAEALATTPGALAPKPRIRVRAIAA